MLTDAKCRNARKAEKPQKLSDAHGLYLYITPTGFKSWRMKYRFASKEKRLTFGGYPEVSLADARELRNAARLLLRGGIDPAIERKQRQATVASESLRLFEPIARAWHEAQTPTWSPRYAAKALASMEKDIFPPLGNIPIGSITVPMVLRALRAVEERAAIDTAHRLRQHMSDIFLYAIGAGLTDSDPAHVVKPALLPMTKGRRPAVRLAARQRLCWRRSKRWTRSRQRSWHRACSRLQRLGRALCAWQRRRNSRGSIRRLRCGGYRRRR